MDQKVKNGRFYKCPICSSDKIAFLNGFEKLYLVKCNTCSFIFDKRVPTEQELNEHYKVYAYSKLKPLPELTKVSYNKLLDSFEQYRKTGNILDIGCGQGDFLVEAKKRNWKVYGSEYSKAAVNLCINRNINMHQGQLTNKVFSGVDFDVITSFEVLEHLNNPNEFMSVAQNKLKSGGLFYCTTPNFNSILRNFEKDKFKMILYPEHISFYTKKSIENLGETHNFYSKKTMTTGIDLGRLKNVFKRDKQSNNAQDDMVKLKQTNETIRNLAGSNPLVGIIKNIINFLLSIVSKGDTLKVYWIKK